MSFRELAFRSAAIKGDTKKERKQNLKLFEQAQKQLKISKVNKPHELKAIQDLMAGYREAQRSPTLQAVGKSLGITNYNSINDYSNIVSHMQKPQPAAAPAPAPAPAPAAPVTPAYTPTPLVPEPQDSQAMQSVPEPLPSPPPQFMPGGTGSSVDSGATGFRRKKSSARAAGLTTKGSARLRINPASTGSSGLNIGL